MSTELYYRQQLMGNLSETRFRILIAQAAQAVRNRGKIDINLELSAFCKRQSQHAWVVALPTPDLETLLNQNISVSIDLGAMQSIIKTYRERFNFFNLRKSRESRTLACELDAFLAEQTMQSTTEYPGLFIFELYHILRYHLQGAYSLPNRTAPLRELYDKLMPFYIPLAQRLEKIYPLYQVYYQKGDGEYCALKRAARIIKAYEQDDRYALQKSSESTDLIDGSDGLKSTLNQDAKHPFKEEKILNLYHAFARENKERTLYTALAPLQQDLLDSQDQRAGKMPSYLSNLRK